MPAEVLLGKLAFEYFPTDYVSEGRLVRMPDDPSEVGAFAQRRLSWSTCYLSRRPLIYSLFVALR
jgi:hypothetical protein